jgi:regulatory protein
MADEKARKHRKPRKATEKSLQNAALFYLERYASSAENLRRVLMRRVQRSARAHDTDEAEAAAWVDDIVKRYCEAGLLDDGAYAEMRVAALRRRGASARAIRANLSAKGVASAVIDKALQEDAAETPQAELAAACAYARRRRIGPWRIREREERRDRDLAARARQGYSVDIARKVIEAEDPEILEAELREEF